MIEDGKLADNVKKGHDANSVLNNQQFKTAFISIKATLINGFEDTNHDQSSERDEIWRKLQSLNWLEAELSDIIQTGKLAQIDLDNRSKQK